MKPNRDHLAAAVLSPNGPTVTHLDEPPLRLFVGTLRGVGILERDSASAPWRTRGAYLNASHVSALAPVPGGVFAGAHSGGLFFSVDVRVWDRMDQGVTADHIFCVHTQNRRGGVRLFAGAQPAALFYSDDIGRSWIELPAIKSVPGTGKWTFPSPPHQAHTKSLAFVAGHDDLIYACIEQGAFLKSVDSGASWREIDSYYDADDRWYRDIHRLVVVPSNPDHMLMTTGMGLYRTTSAGASWAKLTGFDFRIGYPDHIIISPDNERTIFLSGSSEDPSTWRKTHHANSMAMISHDGGDTWTEAGYGLPASGRANIEAMNMAVWPGGFALFAGNTDGEVYCSEDGAKSWRQIGSGFAPVSKVGHYRNLQPVA